ncbi:MAG: energy transducer TonB [Terracidiphilus sp.]
MAYALTGAPQERMPSSEAPNHVDDSAAPPAVSSVPQLDTSPQPGSAAPRTEPESERPVVRGSRWVDYDTHELLQMISELEDERRWARLREGFWIAILIHLALLSAVTWLPKYVFKVPVVVDSNRAINEHKDFQYFDSPLNLKPPPAQPKVKINPVPEKPPVIDQKTLDALNRATSPPAPAPMPAPPAPVQPAQPIPPAPEAQVEAPRPAAVPARPNFALGSQNPADQLREAMRNAARNPGQGNAGNLGSGGLARHPGAGSGGVEVLSPTEGVDFNSWLQRWHWETERTWDPLIPDEVNPPILKSGMVAIRFKVLPNGRLMDGSLVLEGRSGDVALDRAAWGALTGSNYPPLPRDFHGPYLELRAFFLYNMEPSR